MLNCFDEERAVAKAGSPGAFQDILNEGLDGSDLAILFTDEGDAATRFGGDEREGGGLPGEQTGAAEAHFA